MKFKTYLDRIEEEFNQESYLKDALEWLKTKFPDNGFDFKHKPNMINGSKTYNVSINNKEFDIEGRLMDTNSDGEKDTVLFRINPVEEEPEEPEETF